MGVLHKAHPPAQQGIYPLSSRMTGPCPLRYAEQTRTLPLLFSMGLSDGIKQAIHFHLTVIWSDPLCLADRIGCQRTQVCWHLLLHRELWMVWSGPPDQTIHIRSAHRPCCFALQWWHCKLEHRLVKIKHFPVQWKTPQCLVNASQPLLHHPLKRDQRITF